MIPYASIFSVLTTSSPLEEMRQRLVGKLRSMAGLRAGWSHGEGLPVTADAINAGEDLILLASDLGLQADVFANLDGGCAIAFYAGEDSVEISIGPEGDRFGMRVERGIGFDFEDVIPPAKDVSLEDAFREVVQLIQDDRWKLPAFFISGTLTQPSSASEIQSLSILSNQLIPQLLQTAEGGSQSSRLLVPVLA